MNDNELTDEEKSTNRDEQNLQTIVQQSTVTNGRNTSQIREENSTEQQQIQEEEQLQQ